MNDLLLGKTALVTGGSSGIGFAIAKKLASQGAEVIIFGTNPEKGEKALVEIRQINPEKKPTFVAVNVAHGAEVESAILKFPKIDILVNCAGITRDGLLLKMTEEDWDQVMST